MRSARKAAKAIREADVKLLAGHVVFLFKDPQRENEGVTWSRVGKRLDSLEWKARYAPDTLTKEEIMGLAGIAAAYRQLVYKPGDLRTAICVRLQEYDDSEQGDE